MRIHGKKMTVLVWLVLGFVLSISAQDAVKTPEPGFKNEFRTLKLKSKLMGREMSYRVILPYFYEPDNTMRFPVIYLLHGLGGHFDNWTDKTKITRYSFFYEYIIVMPEGGDGWYTDSISVPADKYESYMVQELVPEVDAKFRTIADREQRAIAGLSMGGYGALKFGLKYPDKFAVAGSFSGALDGPLRGQEHQFLRASIISVFGPEDSKVRKDNDIFRIVRELPAEKINGLPYLYLDCGTEDWLFQTNRDFAELLLKQKIPHEFRQLPGKHDWNFWDAEAREFLELAAKTLKDLDWMKKNRPGVDTGLKK